MLSCPSCLGPVRLLCDPRHQRGSVFLAECPCRSLCACSTPKRRILWSFCPGLASRDADVLFHSAGRTWIERGPDGTRVRPRDGLQGFVDDFVRDGVVRGVLSS
jgi:hypothetical protein